MIYICIDIDILLLHIPKCLFQQMFAFKNYPALSPSLSAYWYFRLPFRPWNPYKQSTG